MQYLDQYTLLTDAAKRMMYSAKQGLWEGKQETLYFKMCKWCLERYPCTAIFTRDTGYHSGGWWKNPDYERCYHLSMSFEGGQDKRVVDQLLKLLFGDYVKYIWVEPPYTKEGKALNVWHYRLFCDTNWMPIKPRGEVYSTQFTEKGWKSFSELNAQP